MVMIYILWWSVVCLSRKIITSHLRAKRWRRKVSSPLGLVGRWPALAYWWWWWYWWCDDDDDGDVISTLQDRMAPPAIALGAARDTPSDMNALWCVSLWFIKLVCICFCFGFFFAFVNVFHTPRSFECAYSAAKYFKYRNMGHLSDKSICLGPP